MRLLLSEPLPLRTTRMLGDFADDRPLALRLGDLTRARFKLLRLSDTRFFVADHPFAVTGAFVEDERTLAYEAKLERDDAGHTWTIVEFSSPVPPQAVVTAVGRGMLSPVTGALIENPADLMELVAGLAGFDYRFPDLRAQAAAEGLRLALSVDEMKPTNAWLDEIARSAGAMWIPGASVLYPSTDVFGPIIELGRADVPELEDAVANLDDTADVLRLAYDRSDATGRAQRYIQLEASPKLYGGVEAEIFLPHLRIPANAEIVGTRLLKRMAGRRYDLSFEAKRRDVRPCRRVRIVDHPQWHVDAEDPVIMVITAGLTPDSKSSRITGETLVSTPDVEVTAHSVALSDTSEGGVDVEFREGIVTFTVREDNGRPLPGAKVSLDGGLAKVTDEQGKVSFATAPGDHVLLIEKAGFDTIRVELTIGE